MARTEPASSLRPPKTSASRTHERVEMLRRQSEPLPVYKHVPGGPWKYLGRYRVQSITEGGKAASERSRHGT
jgi:hypothetical protein